MTSAAGPAFCGDCGTKLKPLFTGSFCPNNCDRRPKSTLDDDWDDSPTPVTFFPACPGCKSCNTATFNMPGQSLLHCWDCGHVW